MDQVIFVRIDEYYVGVCDSYEAAADMILESGFDEDYTKNYIMYTMGFGINDYGVASRDLVGVQAEKDKVYVTFADEIDDINERVQAYGSYDEAAAGLAGQLDLTPEEVIEEASKEDAYEIRILELTLGTIMEDLVIDWNDLV